MRVDDLPDDVRTALRNLQTHRVYAASYVETMTDLLRKTFSTERRRHIISELSRAKAELKKADEVLAGYSDLEGFQP